MVRLYPCYLIFVQNQSCTNCIYSLEIGFQAMLLRKFSVYETQTHFYFVGSDAAQKRYRLLKVNRSDPFVLNIGEVEQEYTRNDIMELLATVSDGNSIVFKTKGEKQLTALDRRKGITERASNAFGLLGAVRFLEGYYILIVTKARVVANVGYHEICKIEEVALITLSSGELPPSSDEQRYLKLFQSVDLSTDFYFSYTYDMSRTLQENAMNVSGWPKCKEKTNDMILVSEEKFIWNSFLLDPLRKSDVSEKWLIEIVHGYVGQQIIELPCSRLALILFARRSSKFAGTRFLKRGTSLEGCVANDVETEQIVWDTLSSPDFRRGKFTAFVQRRGSVPLIWSQDPATRGVVGKPLITVDINEPHAQTAAAHFRDLRKRYGNPLVVINLVKRREKRRHEALLHDQFLKAVNYLNLFLPGSERIAYISFDVARCHKTGNVLSKLEEIGLKTVLKQGWFQSFPPLYCHKIRPNVMLSGFDPSLSPNGRFILQSGITRTNCVDCLDRTNVAQFGIGKVALGMQLYSMGFVGEPVVSSSSQVCRMYEDLIDEHGDTLACQYAGSQLVHSIKTYKKISMIQERSRDVIQTLSRYYSNTFADYDKQSAINLFLGVFRPDSSGLHLWNLGSDRYLHFPTEFKTDADYCAWFVDLDEYEPIESWEDVCDYEFDMAVYRKKAIQTVPLRVLPSVEDLYYSHYRLWEITKFDDLLREQKDLQKAVIVDGVNQSVAQGYSFAKLWKQDASEKRITQLKQETSLCDDDDEEDGPLVKSDTEVHYECGFTAATRNRLFATTSKEIIASEASRGSRGLQTGLLTMKEAYSFELKPPSAEDMARYIKYANMGGCQTNAASSPSTKAGRLDAVLSSSTSDNRLIKPVSIFTSDSAFSVFSLGISKASMRIYKDSVDASRYGPKPPSKADFTKYEEYALKRRTSTKLKQPMFIEC